MIWVLVGLLLSPLAASSKPGEMFCVKPRPIVLKADPRYLPARVPAPAFPKEIDPVNFVVNYNPGSPAGTTPWPADAQVALDQALAIWDLLLDQDRIIEVDAYWRTDMSPGVLATGRAGELWVNFPYRPLENVFFAVALANEYAGMDLNPGEAEIVVSFNATVSWYTGLDGQTPATDRDLLTAALHEICHGLGFSGSFNWDNGQGGDECTGTLGDGCWGLDYDGTALPEMYDRFLENGSGQRLITAFANPSQALGDQLVGDDLFFNGGAASAANGGSPPQLFAPFPWDEGSSSAHLRDATFDGTPHALMTHALARGESAHHPGTIVMGMLQDMLWHTELRFSVVFVDAANSGAEDGSVDHPFNTVEEGTCFVVDEGALWIAPGSYPEHFAISRPMTLFRYGSGGSVEIGE
jgi:hypothetical protein